FNAQDKIANLKVVADLDAADEASVVPVKADAREIVAERARRPGPTDVAADIEASPGHRRRQGHGVEIQCTRAVGAVGKGTRCEGGDHAKGQRQDIARTGCQHLACVSQNEYELPKSYLAKTSKTLRGPRDRKAVGRTQYQIGAAAASRCEPAPASTKYVNEVLRARKIRAAETCVDTLLTNWAGCESLRELNAF